MLKLVSTSLLAMIVLGDIVYTDSPVKNIETDIVGPFKTFQEDSTITYRYQLRWGLDGVNEKLRISNPSTGKVYSIQTKRVHNIGTNVYEVTFDLSLKKFFSVDGFKLEFSILQNTEILDKNISTIYPAESKTVEVTKNKVKSLIGRNTSFKVIKNVTESYHDEFNFVGFKDFIDADNYYSLNLRGNTFLYNQSSLGYSTAKLVLPDTKRIFKYLPHDNEGKVNFDLKISNMSNQMYFEFLEDIYVNPINLDISKTKTADFIKTHSVYLPLNKKRDFVGKDMKIIVYDCGLSKYTLIFDVTYDIFRNLVGSCYDSDYCVKGNVE